MTILHVPVSTAGRDGVAKARAFLGGQQDPDATIGDRRRGLAAFAQANGEPEDVTVQEDVIAGVRVDRITPDKALGRLLYVHGGAYVLGSARTHRSLAASFALASGATALAVDYRLAPEYPYPAAVDDIVAVWAALANDPTPTVWVGDSAGAGLILAAAVVVRDQELPLPHALILLSPWADLTLAGASHQTRATQEAMLTTRGLTIDAARYCADVATSAAGVSPLFAALGGLPAMFIQVGSAEILLDDAQRLHDRLEEAGVPVTLEVWDEMIHAWHAFRAIIPESLAAIDHIGAFARAQLQLVATDWSGQACGGQLVGD